MEMEILPVEMITEILSRLPADSAIGCRGICKQWRSLIDHPSFFDTHTRQLISSSSTYHPKKFGNGTNSSSGLFLCKQQTCSSSSSIFFQLHCIEYNDDEERLVPEFKLISIYDHPFLLYNEDYETLISCNGLVFMGPNPNRPIDMFVCNPFTREYVMLCTPASTPSKFGWDHMAYGFGYLPSTNEYKVVCVYYDHFEAKGQVSVYTLGSGIGWRNKGEILYFLLFGKPGLLSNGAIHWYMYGNDHKKNIVSFDLADEEFRVVVPLPPPAPSPDYIDKLGVLGGCLCVTRDYRICCKGIPEDVWILNLNHKEGEEEEEFSWNKKFSIPWSRNLISSHTEPYVVLKSGKMLLGGGIGIFSYDPKTEVLYEDRSTFPYSNGLCKMIPYTKSFVSLKALGEEDAKCFGGFVGHALAQQQQQQQQG